MIQMITEKASSTYLYAPTSAVCSGSDSPKAKANAENRERRKALLGTTEASTQNDSAAFSRALWNLQRVMWSVTKDKTLAGCHRWRAPNSGLVSLDWSPLQTKFGGLQNSNSVWGSPVASARIGRLRADEVGRALGNWVDDDENDVAFLTLTLRHNRTQPLKSVWDCIARCWNSLTRSASWRGTAKYAGDVDKYGIEHWIKSTEVTYGENGWHVHLHVLLLLNKSLTSKDRKKLESRIYKRWSAAAERRGFVAPSRERGVKLDLAVEKKDVEALGAYLTKGQLNGIDGLAHELTSGQVVKTARNGNMSPFQLLAVIDDKRKGQEDYSRELAAWLEWEKGSKGRRQLNWSRGAKDALGVHDLDDAELLENEDELIDSTAHTVAVFTPNDWREIQSDVEKRSYIVEYVGKASTPAHAKNRAERILKQLGVGFQSILAEHSKPSDYAKTPESPGRSGLEDSSVTASRTV